VIGALTRMVASQKSYRASCPEYARPYPDEKKAEGVCLIFLMIPQPPRQFILLPGASRRGATLIASDLWVSQILGSYFRFFSVFKGAFSH
jgi:hypothetical protein